MHTVVLSDLHLSDAPTIDPTRPMWKAYKRAEFFIDADVARLLDYIEAHAAGPIELVLNGDIFDFDNITAVPEGHGESVDWLARLRGLSSEEWMSLFKINRIIADHRPWFERLARFIAAGHRVVFVIGNHDTELHWPRVQRRVVEILGLDPTATVGSWSAPGTHGTHPEINLLSPAASLAAKAAPATTGAGADVALQAPTPVVFCNWFYLSDGDTYISHGHMYDPNCSVESAIDPLVMAHGRPRVRLPFGDLAERYMLNGMGYFNPHATENYIMSGMAYLRFFFRHMARTQPFLLWTWFWGTVATLVISLREHWRPALSDPLLVEEKVREIAERSRVEPSVVRRLHALNVPPATTNPIRILRELWLDRAFLLLLVLWIAWQFVLLVNFVWPISPLWVLLPLAVLLPPFFSYALNVNPTVFRQPLLTRQRAEWIAKITGVRRVIFGHTHEPECTQVGPVSYFNSGFWSAAFAEPTCEHRIGTQTFVWLREPAGAGAPRAAELLEWPPGATEPRAYRRDHVTSPSFWTA